MLPVILSNGLGIDSEELELFIDEKIADLTLAERILLILASEGFDEAFLIADIPKISFNRPLRLCLLRSPVTAAFRTGSKDHLYF